MAWTGVITNVGNQMLSAWVAGTTCNIARAAAGTGTVNEAALLAQTSLVETKQEMSVLALDKVDNGYKVKLQLTAPAVGYSLNQIGIWASLDNGEYTMLAIFQRGDGVPIPGNEESPDFAYSFYGVLAVSSDGDMTISVDASAIVTASTMQAAVAAHNADLTAHSNQRHVIATRIRDPGKPAYGLGGGGDQTEVAVALDTSDYTGEAEVSVIVSGDEYDAENMSANGGTAPDGTLIIKVEE